MPLLTNPADLDRVARVEARQILLAAAEREDTPLAFGLRQAILSPDAEPVDMDPYHWQAWIAVRHAFLRLFFVEPTDELQD